MSRINDIYKQLYSLPKGYISQKTISGNKYYYLQRKENGKVVSFLIKKPDLESTIQKLKERKELEAELKSLLEQDKPLAILNKNTKELNGYLMMGDIEVAYFKKGIMEWMYEDEVPFIIKRTESIRPFLESRLINKKRTNASVLKESLNLKGISDEELVLYSHAATITDNYWFKPKGSRLTYNDICFDKDLYSDVALKGEKGCDPKKARLSPELTLNGSHEKCWKIEDGHWFLYKAETEEEIESEIISSCVAELLNIPTVSYKKVDEYIKTANFAEKYNFEPISSLVGEDSSYEKVLNALLRLSKNIAKQYLDLIWFDVIVNNTGRHNHNCGLLRDRQTGQVISLAPNFGNSHSLFGNSRNLIMDPQEDQTISNFINFVLNNEFALEYFLDKKIKKIKKDNFEEYIESVLINFDKETVVEYIHARYKYIRKYFSNLKDE